MKILHIVRQFHPAKGGLENVVLNISKRQVEKGHHVQVFTLDRIFYTDESLLKEDCIEGIEVKRHSFVGSYRYPISISLLRSFYIGSWDVVFVHATDFFYDFVPLVNIVSRSSNKLFTLSHGFFFHSSESLLKRLWFSSITRSISSLYDSVICVSATDFQRAQKSLNITRLVKLENAVEPFPGVGSKNGDVLYVGRISPNKRVSLLVSVLSTYLKRTENTLHIVGPNTDLLETEKLKKVMIDMKLEKYVEIHGYVEEHELEAIISKSTFFASASEYEGFGLSLIEGAAASLIPVCHNNESFTYLLRDGAGLIKDFNSVDVDLLAEEMESYLVDEDKRLEEVDQLLRMCRNYSWPAYMERLEGIINGHR